MKKFFVKKIRNFFRVLKKPFINHDNYWEKNIPEIDANNKLLIESVDDYTMTPLIRRWNLIKALHYINKKKIEGDIVESGIWRGGNLFFTIISSGEIVIKFGLDKFLIIFLGENLFIKKP